jgi:hypothetical protein
LFYERGNMRTRQMGCSGAEKQRLRSLVTGSGAGARWPGGPAKVVDRKIEPMHPVRFTTVSSSNGVVERDFLVGEVPGVLWSPYPAPITRPWC